MTNPTITELATRVEEATGPDLDLDHAIGSALGDHGNYSYRPYTCSLDAAMQLVPEGWRPVIDLASEEGAALVDLWALPVATPKPERRHAKAATPALALTAACLRAISQKGDG
jgi:hypothetical protein